MNSAELSARHDSTLDSRESKKARLFGMVLVLASPYCPLVALLFLRRYSLRVIEVSGDGTAFLIALPTLAGSFLSGVLFLVLGLVVATGRARLRSEILAAALGLQLLVIAGITLVLQYLSEMIPNSE
jgi:hypothetical protein